jgi:hypothetical protein
MGSKFQLKGFLLTRGFQGINYIAINYKYFKILKEEIALGCNICLHINLAVCKLNRSKSNDNKQATHHKAHCEVETKLREMRKSSNMLR